MKNTEISKLLGEMWRNASETDRKPHIDREMRERTKYKIATAEWKEKEEVKKEAARRALEEQMEQMRQYGMQNSHPHQQVQGGYHYHGRINVVPQGPGVGQPMQQQVGGAGDGSHPPLPQSEHVQHAQAAPYYDPSTMYQQAPLPPPSPYRAQTVSNPPPPYGYASYPPQLPPQGYQPVYRKSRVWCPLFYVLQYGVGLPVTFHTYTVSPLCSLPPP